MASRFVFFIIEHPTRGVLQTETTDEGKPRFAWSTPRGSEGDAKYNTLRRAIQDLNEMPLPKGSHVRRSDTGWPVVWPLS